MFKVTQSASDGARIPPVSGPMCACASCPMLPESAHLQMGLSCLTGASVSGVAGR